MNVDSSQTYNPKTSIMKKFYLFYESRNANTIWWSSKIESHIAYLKNKLISCKNQIEIFNLSWICKPVAYFSTLPSASMIHLSKISMRIFLSASKRSISLSLIISPFNLLLFLFWSNISLLTYEIVLYWL